MRLIQKLLIDLLVIEMTTSSFGYASSFFLISATLCIISKKFVLLVSQSGFKSIKSHHLYMKSRFLVQMVACVICQRINLPSNPSFPT